MRKLPLILIVEDEVALTVGIRESLEETQRFRVELATTGLDALAKLKRYQPLLGRNEIECILLDQRMPDLNGMQFLVKKQTLSKSIRQVPVVFQTTHTMPIYYAEATKFDDVADFLPKIHEKQQLLDLVEAICYQNGFKALQSKFRQRVAEKYSDPEELKRWTSVKDW